MPNHSGQSGSPFSTGPGFDGFEFLKRMWGQSPMSHAMPTTNLDELDKRITDLKAVEQWLNLNVSMLRTTIQGLEVQRGTIAALKTFGQQFGQPFGQQFGTSPAGSGSTKAHQAPKDKSTKESQTKASQTEASPSDSTTKTVTDTTQAMMAGATAWWNAFQEGLQTVSAEQQKNKNDMMPAKQPETTDTNAANSFKAADKPLHPSADEMTSPVPVKKMATRTAAQNKKAVSTPSGLAKPPSKTSSKRTRS